MAEAFHTPGPWLSRELLKRDEDGRTTVEANEVLAGEIVIAPDVHNDLDARLIAAAPDMLAALREAERILSGLEIDEDCHFTADIRSAIAKAEGRTDA